MPSSSVTGDDAAAAARSSSSSSSSSIEERLMGLIRAKPPPTPHTRALLLEHYRPRLAAIGLGIEDELCAALAPTVIHVAGTKGKGSTCALVESALRRAGLRTGLLTSPHLVRINERVRINGRPVGDDVLEEHFTAVHDALAPQGLVPGFFSFLTLMGFHILAQTPLDVVIVEVGLGGRLDTTNVLGRPSACVVTLLDLDHTEVLGDTIEAIAMEKAGIFKRGAPALVAPGQDPRALQVLRAKAAEAGVASFTVVEPLDRSWPLGLAGVHQYANAGLAVAACRACFAEDRVSEQALRVGMQRCSWPGRSQHVQVSVPSLSSSPDPGSPLPVDFFLDGAHTPRSMVCALDWFSSARNPPASPPAGDASICAETRGATSSSKSGSGKSGSGKSGSGKSGSGSSSSKSVLLFNCMHSRDPVALLREFAGRALRFDVVLFAPGLSTKATTVKMQSAAQLLGDAVDEGGGKGEGEVEGEATWQQTLAVVWRRLRSEDDAGADDAGADDAGAVLACSSLEEGLEEIRRVRRAQPAGTTVNALVTGSLLLVGDVMKSCDIPVSAEDEDEDAVEVEVEDEEGGRAQVKAEGEVTKEREDEASGIAIAATATAAATLPKPVALQQQQQQ